MLFQNQRPSLQRRRQSILNSEGIPMTMQVGMVAADGIVLASDTQWTHTPEKLLYQHVGRAVRYHTNCSKIKMSNGMAVSYALDKRTAEDTAGVILTTFDANDP